MSQAKFPKTKRPDSSLERIVYCLCIDIVGSTQAGLEMDSRQRNEFNKLIVEYVQPYLAEFELDDALQKFTGDGWLIMRPGEESARPLVALAKTLCHRFEKDIAIRSKNPPAMIPGIRASLFSGLDLPVTIRAGPQDKKGIIDYVGDSARRACRYNAC